LSGGAYHDLMPGCQLSLGVTSPVAFDRSTMTANSVYAADYCARPYGGSIDGRYVLNMLTYAVLTALATFYLLEDSNMASAEITSKQGRDNSCRAPSVSCGCFFFIRFYYPSLLILMLHLSQLQSVHDEQAHVWHARLRGGRGRDGLA
jgi:hypothetical protein